MESSQENRTPSPLFIRTGKGIKEIGRISKKAKRSRTDQADRTDRVDRTDCTNRADRTDWVGRTGGLDPTNEPDGPDGPGRLDRAGALVGLLGCCWTVGLLGCWVVLLGLLGYWVIIPVATASGGGGDLRNRIAKYEGCTAATSAAVRQYDRDQRQRDENGRKHRCNASWPGVSSRSQRPNAILSDV